MRDSKDRIISELFTLAGYCQGIIIGLEFRMRDKGSSEEEILLFNSICSTLRRDTDSLLVQYSEILDN
jgi:hypothetical protein